MIIGVCIGALAGAGGALAFFPPRAGASSPAPATKPPRCAKRQARGRNDRREITLAARQEHLKAKESFEREQETQRRRADELDNRLNKREERSTKAGHARRQRTPPRRPRRQNRPPRKSSRRPGNRDRRLAEQQREQLLGLTSLSVEQARICSSAASRTRSAPIAAP